MMEKKSRMIPDVVEEKENCCLQTWSLLGYVTVKCSSLDHKVWSTRAHLLNQSSAHAANCQIFSSFLFLASCQVISFFFVCTPNVFPSTGFKQYINLIQYSQQLPFLLSLSFFFLYKKDISKVNRSA